MTSAQEVPNTNIAATATAAIVVNPTRSATGQVNGGTVTFNIAYDGFPAPTTFTGLHIHEAAVVAANIDDDSVARDVLGVEIEIEFLQ